MRYRATICRMGFHEARQAIPTNHREMRSHLRLAQNDKRKSEDDGRGDHGSELGKYRPESAGSEWQCLAPCSPTKIVHVGLHGRRRAGLTAQPQPAPAPQGGRSTQGNNRAVNKRTVRHRRKIGAAAWHAAAEARTGRPGLPFFRRGFPDCAVASVGRRGTLTTPIFAPSRARSAPHHDVYRPLSAPIGLCRGAWRRRSNAAHKHAVNASLSIRKLSAAAFATIFHVSKIDGETRGLSP